MTYSAEKLDRRSQGSPLRNGKQFDRADNSGI